jgi:glycosyltransferase involved in cell wall biosynthesis
MRVLVATITHRADDARIFAREIPALLDADIDVTAVAPWKASRVDPDRRLRAIDIPRTRGLRRTWPLIQAMRRIRRESADLILVHDPELAIALAWTNLRHRVVWDVHEDVAAALRSKVYLPRALRPLLAAAVAGLERRVERRLRGLLLAEERYADRFAQHHPIVLNLPRIPEALPTGLAQRRVVYVGSITRARGLVPMLEIARQLQRDEISMLLIGEIPSAEDRDLLRSAPNVTWTGPLPNDHALELVQQSLAGLSLLADLPNYRHSMPTKVVEYMARGVPVISTPLAVAEAALGETGVIVSFDHGRCVDEAVAAIRALAADEQRRQRMRVDAFARVSERYNWNVAQREFVAALRNFATQDL